MEPSCLFSTKILLRRQEVNSDEPDNGSRAPLSYSAARGHEGVAKILLEREEVNPNKPDNQAMPDGRNLCCQATRK